MVIREITDNISYVGVNDRVKQRFEGLWPLPYGVSYNSYIVKGEKHALIDTVDYNESAILFDEIFSTEKGRTLDYLVVNHMEPDHSGSIPQIINANPGIKVVGNARTIDMIKGFYHIGNDNSENLFIVVKDGDELDLGGKKLRFYITPMVHWPETMMTYIEEERILFSGDAFGTFGALNGSILDNDMDTEIYFREMIRYYSNIVGKYGQFVQKALLKLSALKLNYICPTHGPIWNKHIDRVVDITDKLSRYEAEEGVVIIYGSMYGNTERLAEAAAIQAASMGVRNIRIHNASYSELSDIISDIFRFKGLIIGSPTYSMQIFPPVESVLKAMETRELKNRVVGLFGSFTWASASAKRMTEYIERMNLPLAGVVEMKQSPDRENIEDIMAMAERVVLEMRKNL